MSTLKYKVAAFYKFVELSESELSELQSVLRQFCQKENILGTVILAKEGINATVAGHIDAIQGFLQVLTGKPLFQDLDCKFSYSNFLPFKKLKVTRKKEIVTFKIPNILPSRQTGQKVSAARWNEIIQESDTLVIDTRNSFEFEYGTMNGAINPETQKFSDFPSFVKRHLDPKKHRKIAMFCTGGIRCEKASAYLLQEGFDTVYQLEGGILRYLETVKEDQSLWTGKCFVFDDRISLDKI